MATVNVWEATNTLGGYSGTGANSKISNLGMVQKASQLYCCIIIFSSINILFFQKVIQGFANLFTT